MVASGLYRCNLIRISSFKKQTPIIKSILSNTTHFHHTKSIFKKERAIKTKKPAKSERLQQVNYSIKLLNSKTMLVVKQFIGILHQIHFQVTV